ncbi:MAG: hypothetical protein VR64_04070 [Desulfatitalea sp. BRH_c12]|nr:MAG: hypothetical protein VR64_04070 [Desulfatitalea sp. BRH_c12]
MNLSGLYIHAKIALGEPDGLRPSAGPPDESMNAGQQLGERERFDQVMIAPCLKPSDSVVQCTLGAQNNDGDAGILTPSQLFHQSKPVYLR